MAIALDTSSNSGAIGSGVSSFNWSHTCTGSNLTLVVAVEADGDTVSGVTYNGVSMTQVASNVGDGDLVNLSLWILNNPSTGANSVAVTMSSGTPANRGAIACAASYTGTMQSGQPDSSNSVSDQNSGGGGTWSLSDTTVADNCWLVAALGTAFGVSAAGSNTTIRQNQGAAGTGGGSCCLADSNGAVTPPGSHGLNWNASTNFAGAGIIILGLSPVSPSLTINVPDTTAVTDSAKQFITVLKISVVETTPVTDQPIFPGIPQSAPIVSFRSASAPYGVISAITYTQSALGGNLLPVNQGENSSPVFFRIYNNFLSTAPIATMFNVRLTTFDGVGIGSHTATQSPVAQSWVHIYETGFGESSVEPGIYTYYLGNDTAIGRSGADSYYPEYASDGTNNSYIRAGAGVGFIEFGTYINIPNGAGFGNYSLALSVLYQWSS